MEQIKDKRGIATLGLIFAIVGALAILVIMGVTSYSFGLVDDSLSQLTGELGNTSINETYQNTLKLGLTSLESTFPTIITTGVLLGMILCLMFVGYKTKKMDRLWMLIDVGIIIVAEILVVAVRAGFVAYMNSSPEILAVFRGTLSDGAKFILNGPVLVPTIGIIIMLATHFLTKEKEEEELRQF